MDQKLEVVIDLAGYRNRLGWRNKLGRVLWGLVWLILYRPTPRPMHAWRRFLLRCFGAKVGAGAHPYGGSHIRLPWNLEMGKASCLSDGVDCYCVAPISLGDNSLVSQYSYLCSASHDFTDPAFPLITSPIVIGEGAWVAARAFVGPGVTVGAGAVVGACACVYKDVEPWTVVGGNPARFIKKRVISH